MLGGTRFGLLLFALSHRFICLRPKTPLATARVPVFNGGMKAVQLVSHGAPGRLEVRELPDPQPGASEVVVRVYACGLNRLDLWMEEDALPIRVELPRTPGGEICG